MENSNITNTDDREAFTKYCLNRNLPVRKYLTIDGGFYGVTMEYYKLWQAAIAYKESLDGWRLIEEAPSDGTRIIACVKGFNPTIAWYVKGEWRNADGLLADWKFSDEFMIMGNNEWFPTHFRPLPQPPKENV